MDDRLIAFQMFGKGIGHGLAPKFGGIGVVHIVRVDIGQTLKIPGVLALLHHVRNACPVIARRCGKRTRAGCLVSEVRSDACLPECLRNLAGMTDDDVVAIRRSQFRSTIQQQDFVREAIPVNAAEGQYDVDAWSTEFLRRDKPKTVHRAA